MNRAAILDEAKRLTTTDREKDYGDCVGTHRKIAAVWSVILDRPVTAKQVALCMAEVKIVRACNGTENDDNYIDGAAYMAIAGECAGVGGDKASAGPHGFGRATPVTSAEPAIVRSAYKNGYAAAKHSKHTGMTTEDCPYDVAILRREWLRGWDGWAAESARPFPEDCSG